MPQISTVGWLNFGWLAEEKFGWVKAGKTMLPEGQLRWLGVLLVCTSVLTVDALPLNEQLTGTLGWLAGSFT